MNYEDQIQYIEQLIQRFRNDVYDRAKISKSKRDWKLTDSYSSTDSKTECDFVLHTGNRCNRPIKNIFVVKNTTSNEIIKVGSTCLKKLLGVPKENEFKAAEFYSHNEELDKKEKSLKNALEESKKLAATDTKELINFSTNEKEEIIDKARELDIFPPSMESLVSAGIPLSSSEYIYLQRNTKRLDKELKEKNELEEQERQKVQKTREEKELRNEQAEKARVQQDNKFKETQKGKQKMRQNRTSSNPKSLPYLFGNQGNTAIETKLTDPLRKVFIESGIDKEKLQSDDDNLLSIVKKLSDYFCESLYSANKTDYVSLALIMVTIRDYYKLGSEVQSTLQNRIKERTFMYFENELTERYNLKLISKGELGFKYSTK